MLKIKNNVRGTDYLQIVDIVFWLLVNEKVILIVNLDENQ